MKRILIIALMLTMFVVTASAAPIVQDGEASGALCWPEDAAEADAVFVYRYTYPHFTEDNDVALAVNETFSYLVEDAAAFTLPLIAETVPEDGHAETVITSEITCLNDEFLSVRIITRSDTSGEPTEVLSAVNFFLQGGREGIATSLPRVMGILKDDETDEWMLDRQTAKTDKLVRELVWARIEAGEGAEYREDLTYESFEMDFYPEEDFYMDGEGKLVFFIQAGILADEDQGVLLYPFTLEELKDEL